MSDFPENNWEGQYSEWSQTPDLPYALGIILVRILRARLGFLIGDHAKEIEEEYKITNFAPQEAFRILSRLRMVEFHETSKEKRRYQIGHIPQIPHNILFNFDIFITDKIFLFHDQTQIQALKLLEFLMEKILSPEQQESIESFVKDKAMEEPQKEGQKPKMKTGKLTFLESAIQQSLEVKPNKSITTPYLIKREERDSFIQVMGFLCDLGILKQENSSFYLFEEESSRQKLKTLALYLEAQALIKSKK